MDLDASGGYKIDKAIYLMIVKDIFACVTTDLFCSPNTLLERKFEMYLLSHICLIYLTFGIFQVTLAGQRHQQPPAGCRPRIRRQPCHL